jgi:hypothetical protein
LRAGDVDRPPEDRLGLREVRIRPQQEELATDPVQLGLEHPLVVIVRQHEGAVDRLEGLGEAPQGGLDLGGEPKDIGPEEPGAHGAADGEPPSASARPSAPRPMSLRSRLSTPPA